MSNDNWIKKMRQRLADDEAKVPGDLWSRIEGQLGECSPQRSQKRVRTIRFTVWATAVAAAAAALLILVTHTRVPNADSDGVGGLVSGGKGDVCALMPRSATHTKKVHTGVVARLGAEKVLGSLVEAENASCKMSATDSVGFDVKATLTEDVASTITPSVAEQNQQQNQQQNKQQSATMHDGNRLLASATSADKPRRNNRWTIQAHASGGVVEARSSRQPGHSMLMACAKGDFLGTSNYSVLLTRYNEVKHHSQPMSYGISVGYAITRRLSLATGVAYTYASSDFCASSGDDNIVATQRLHYIGVPISVKYKLWGTRLMQIYASAGAQADFNVAASTTSNGITADTQKDHAQFSANAAAGVQLNFLPKLGVYAEPGVRYYFDNNSKVETIFKEKPCCFSLQVGLRLDL